MDRLEIMDKIVLSKRATVCFSAILICFVLYVLSLYARSNASLRMFRQNVEDSVMAAASGAEERHLLNRFRNCGT